VWPIMIKGIGVDIVSVGRLERWLGDSGLLERFFHPEELAACRSRAASLAARFAAKEAFVKALGTGFRGMALKDIIVTNQANGKPEMQVRGAALDALVKNGANKIHISLTHERENAVAMVVLEATEPAKCAG